MYPAEVLRFRAPACTTQLCIARAHTHTRVRVYTGRTAYTWIYVAVHARLGQAHVHAWNRGKVRVRARGTRACAAIHTPVPLGEGHTPISGDRGDRDSSTTRVCLSKPARVSKVHSAGYEGCDSFLPSEEREKREREETSSGISSGISYESSSIAGLRDIGIVIEEDRGPSDETRFWIYSVKWISFDRTELVR